MHELNSRWSRWRAAARVLLPFGWLTLVVRLAPGRSRRLASTALVLGLAGGGLFLPVAPPRLASAASWSTWQSVDPTTTTQHPVATTVFGGRLYLFEVDTSDTRIWYKTMAPFSNWSAWSTAGGPPPAGTVLFFSPGSTSSWNRSTPLAAAVYNNRLYLFAVGTDDRIYDNSSPDGATWSGWQLVGGGPAYFGPAATVFNGQLLIFFVDSTYEIYSRAFDGTTWQGAQPIDSRTYAAPAATVYNGQLHLFAVGTDNRVYDNISPDGASWSGWQAIDSNTRWAPAASTFTDGRLHLFAIGTGIGALWENTSNGAGWSGWSPLPWTRADGGGMQPLVGPAATAIDSAGRLYVFAVADSSPLGRIWVSTFG
jgi:hypothetical protein